MKIWFIGEVRQRRWQVGLGADEMKVEAVSEQGADWVGAVYPFSEDASDGGLLI